MRAGPPCLASRGSLWGKASLCTIGGPTPGRAPSSLLPPPRAAGLLQSELPERPEPRPPRGSEAGAPRANSTSSISLFPGFPQALGPGSGSFQEPGLTWFRPACCRHPPGRSPPPPGASLARRGSTVLPGPACAPSQPGGSGQGGPTYAPVTAESCVDRSLCRCPTERSQRCAVEEGREAWSRC